MPPQTMIEPPLCLCQYSPPQLFQFLFIKNGWYNSWWPFSWSVYWLLKGQVHFSGLVTDLCWILPHILEGHTAHPAEVCQVSRKRLLGNHLGRKILFCDCKTVIFQKFNFLKRCVLWQVVSNKGSLLCVGATLIHLLSWLHFFLNNLKTFRESKTTIKIRRKSGSFKENI